MVSDNLSAMNAFGDGMGISAHNVANVTTPNFKSEQFTYGSDPVGNVEVQRRPQNEPLGDVVNQRPTQTAEQESDSSAQQFASAINNDVDLPREFVSQISAQNSFEANVIAVTTRTDMEQDLYSQVHGPSIVSYQV